MTSKTGSGSSGSKSDGRQGNGGSNSRAPSTKNGQQDQSTPNKNQNAPGSTFGDSHGQQDKAGHQNHR